MTCPVCQKNYANCTTCKKHKMHPGCMKQQVGSNDPSGTIDRRQWYSTGTEDGSAYDNAYFVLPMMVKCDQTFQESVEEHNRLEPTQMTSQRLNTVIGTGPIFLSKAEAPQNFHMNQFVKVGTRNEPVTLTGLMAGFLDDNEECDGYYVAGFERQKKGNFTYYTPDYKVY